MKTFVICCEKEINRQTDRHTHSRDICTLYIVVEPYESLSTCSIKKNYNNSLILGTDLTLAIVGKYTELVYI